MAANVGKIIHLTFMEPIPTTGYFFKSVQALNSNRMAYYNAYWTSLGYSFTPSGMLDGRMPDSLGSGSSLSCGNIGDLKQSDIDYEYALTSPFNISATHYFSAAHDSVFGTIVVTANTAIGGHSLRLRTAFARTMNFSQAPGSNNESHFENVARAMFPNVSGQTLTASWPAGSSVTYTYKGKISGLDTFTNVTCPDSTLVIWIQNDSGGAKYPVLQAALSKYQPLAVVNVAASKMKMNVYPNPAHGQATISFALDANADVAVTVYDQIGRRVYSSVPEHMSAGPQQVHIPLAGMAPGLYAVELRAGDKQATEQLSITQ